MEELIAELILKYPQIATVFLIVGILRVVIKPLMAIAKSVAEQTPGTKDDDTVKAAEESKIYKAILFILDWIFSLKPIKFN